MTYCTHPECREAAIADLRRIEALLPSGTATLHTLGGARTYTISELIAVINSNPVRCVMGVEAAPRPAHDGRSHAPLFPRRQQ